MEIVVDAYSEEEYAMAWYCHLEDSLKFPFEARVRRIMAASPLRSGERVSVLGLAHDRLCRVAIFVRAQHNQRELVVPLAQLVPIRDRQRRKSLFIIYKIHLCNLYVKSKTLPSSGLIGLTNGAGFFCSKPYSTQLCGCRRGLIVVLDEFQYFTRARLYAFNSFLQEQVDRLRDTQGGGLFVLGSLQSEMSALLDDKGAPLFGRLTATIDLQHWDFEDLIEVYRAHDIREPQHWLTLWGFFEGVPKFYRDAYDQGLFQVGARFQEALLERMFLREGSPLAEEADTSFLREVKGRLLSVLNFLSEHPGSSHGQLVGTLLRDEDEASLKVTVKRLVENYHMVNKRHPVFSESKSRNSRYYITDNFLQAWLSVVKPARDASRMRPLSKAIDLTLPRLHGHEGYAFEKLIRQLHVECSRKGVGDFSLTSIELGYWNRPRDEQNTIEIDIVALDEDARRIRFGSCKHSASKHIRSSLSEFERHIERFMSTKEGRRVKGWTLTKALFSPVFSDEEARALTAAGYQCLDLPAYVRMLTSPRSV